MWFCLVLLRGNLIFQELGLVADTPVGNLLIDAHAGDVGVMESMSVSDNESKGFFFFYFLSQSIIDA